MVDNHISITSVRVGSRKSVLALKQVEIVKAALQARGVMDNVLWTVNAMDTEGDLNLAVTLDKIGGKGLFTKDLDRVLLGGGVDVTIHSMKDMETTLPQDIAIFAVLPRADVRDVLICSSRLPSFSVKSVDDIPFGCRVGTSSLRRTMQIKSVRPDVEIVPVRGNVQTRLNKLEEGEVDVLILAKAGLDRLGLDLGIPLDESVMLPAVAQGIICITGRYDDAPMKSYFSHIHDDDAMICAMVERAFLKALDGNCRTPIAALAKVEGAHISFKGKVYDALGVCHEVNVTWERRVAVQKAEREGLVLHSKLVSCV